MLNPIQVIAGIIAGAIGAAAWAAIAHYAEVEIGYIAWGIGLLVGVAVAATGKNSPLAGVAAVVITIVSLVGGKYAAVEMAVQSFQAEIDSAANEMLNPNAGISDEVLQSVLANRIVEVREAAGETIEWPEVGEDEESIAVNYPADIWTEAETQFSAKSDEEKATLREEHIASIQEMQVLFGEAMADAAREEGFANSFSMMDILFFGLAIVTAWGIASREEEGEMSSKTTD